MKRIIIFSLAVAIILISAFLSYSEDDKSYVENLIKSKTDEVLAIIKDKTLSESEKKKKIFEVASPLFDFKIMARLTLGKRYWNKLSSEEKEKFVDLFIKRIKMAYLDRVTLYGNETVKFKPAILKGKKRILVPSVISSKGQDFSVLYKFWKSPEGWKIYDVEVEGVSVIRTYRAQFTKILSEGGVKALFEQLETLTKEKKDEKAGK